MHSAHDLRTQAHVAVLKEDRTDDVGRFPAHDGTHRRTENKLPFDPLVPNKKTMAAMNEGCYE